MRSRTWMVTLATAGLLAAGAAAPAYAAEGTAPAAISAPSAERAAASGQDGSTPDMGRMHEQMMKGMQNTASMEEMMQRVPGLAKMCEKMMTATAAAGTPSI